MYDNLKRTKNNELKGDVGEIIAKHHLDGAISTKQKTSSVLKKFNLSPIQIKFLSENWNSFDLIDPQTSTIYEVKTKNYFYGNLKGVKNKKVISPNFLQLYEEAISLDFSFKVVMITFFSDWKYGLEVKVFDKKDFCVCKKKSGWSAWEKKKNKKE